MAFAVGGALAVVGGLAVLWLDEPGVVPPLDPAALLEGGAAAGVDPAADAIRPNEIYELTRDAFPASGPVELVLWLPEPVARPAPHPVRIYSQSDGRVVEAQAAVNGRGDLATFGVDPDDLQPGTYVVEIDTEEPDHEGPRRYVLLVRAERGVPELGTP